MLMEQFNLSRIKILLILLVSITLTLVLTVVSRTIVQTNVLDDDLNCGERNNRCDELGEEYSCVDGECKSDHKGKA